MTNPWSREHFDLDGQNEAIQRGNCREVNGLLLDAGWTPEEAHAFIMQMERARAISEKMEEMDRIAQSGQSYGDNRLEGAMRHMEPVRARPINPRIFNIAVGFAVFLVGVWLTS